MSATQGAWECAHGVDGRDWCEECHSSVDSKTSKCPECGSQDLSFDRSLCACGAMHYFCGGCGRQDDECKEEIMTSMRFLPEEVDALSSPVLAVEGALAGIREAIDKDDTRLVLAYVELIEGAVEKINTIHERMAEPVPIA